MAETREHRSHDERRRQLVDASVAVMTEQGVAAVTTRAVTARAGLPHGSFHYCFDSKADLFCAILEQELGRSIVAAFEPPATPVDPEERIAAGLRARLDQVIARPDYFLALAELSVLSHRDAELGRLARWEQAEYLREVTRNLDEWSRADGLEWSAPTPGVAALLIALTDGIAASWLVERNDDAAHESIRLAAASVSSLVSTSSPSITSPTTTTTPGGAS